MNLYKQGSTADAISEMGDDKNPTSSFVTNGGGNRASMVDRYLMQKYQKLSQAEIGEDNDA